MIIPESQAAHYISLGYNKYDFHVHSACSPDVFQLNELSPGELVKKGRARGLAKVCLSDHAEKLRCNPYDCVGWENPDVLVNLEFKIRDRKLNTHTIHNLVFFDTPGQQAILTEAAARHDIAHFLDTVERLGLGPAIYCHPYWWEFKENVNPRKAEETIDYLLKYGYYKVLENNMHRDPTKNALMRQKAEKYGLEFISATDTHTGDLGRCYTLVRGSTRQEILQNILKGDYCVVLKEYTKDIFSDEANTFIKQLAAVNGQVRMHETPLADTPGEIFGKIIASRYFQDHPRLKEGLLRLCNRLVRTGIPSSLFLGWEAMQGRRIQDLTGSRQVDWLATKYLDAIAEMKNIYKAPYQEAA